SLLLDPHAREIVTVSNRTVPAALLNSLRARPDVAFVAPRIRTLAADLLVENPGQRGQGAHLELIPTAHGDPLLPETPERSDRLVLTAAAAARLAVSAGDTLIGYL